MVLNIKNKWKNMSLAAKCSIALIIVKFFERGLSLVTGPIFTRIMPIEEYGIISTFTSWQSVLMIITTLNMSQGVFNNGMLDFKEDRDSFCFSILMLANLCTIVWLLLFLIFNKTLINFIDMPFMLLILMLLYFFFVPAYNYWIARQRYEFKYKFSSILMISISIISTILSIIIVLFVPNNLKAIVKISITEGVMILIGIIMYINIIIKSNHKLKIKYWKYALKYNLPLIPHYLSMYILASSDRIMISKMIGTSETAIYNVSYTVASILLIFWNSMEASYAPWVYQKMENEDYKSIRKRGNQIILIFAVLMFLSTLFAPEIIKILAPKIYYNGIYIIPSVAGGVFFTALYSLYIRMELYLKKTKQIMIASSIGAILNLILNYIFIPKYGMYAAGYTTLVCYIILALTHYLILKRLNYDKIYDNKRFLILSLIVVASSIIISFMYSYNFIRYILIILIVLGFVVKRNEIKEVFLKK